MKHLLFISLITFPLLAQEAPPPPTHLTNVQSGGNSCGLVIDPKARAHDYVQAFNLLRKDKPTQKIMLRTSTETLSNVTDLTATQNGTLFVIKLLTSQGTKVQILPVEQLMEIAYSPQ